MFRTFKIVDIVQVALFRNLSLPFTNFQMINLRYTDCSSAIFLRSSVLFHMKLVSVLNGVFLLKCLDITGNS